MFLTSLAVNGSGVCLWSVLQAVFGLNSVQLALFCCLQGLLAVCQPLRLMPCFSDEGVNAFVRLDG